MAASFKESDTPHSMYKVAVQRLTIIVRDEPEALLNHFNGPFVPELADGHLRSKQPGLTYRLILRNRHVPLDWHNHLGDYFVFGQGSLGKPLTNTGNSKQVYRLTVNLNSRVLGMMYLPGDGVLNRPGYDGAPRNSGCSMAPFPVASVRGRTGSLDRILPTSTASS